MEQDTEEYGENTVDDMMTDYDYHINTGELPELFDKSSRLPKLVRQPHLPLPTPVLTIINYGL